jgi:hypothetical protein
MNDLTSFYLERKQYLTNLRKKKERDSSSIFSRTINILEKDSEKIVVDNIESISLYKSNINIDNSSFEEKLERFIKELEEKE